MGQLDVGARTVAASLYKCGGADIAIRAVADNGSMRKGYASRGHGAKDLIDSGPLQDLRRPQRHEAPSGTSAAPMRRR